MASGGGELKKGTPRVLIILAEVIGVGGLAVLACCVLGLLAYQFVGMTDISENAESLPVVTVEPLPDSKPAEWQRALPVAEDPTGWDH
jgi:hypothetical protein